MCVSSVAWARRYDEPALFQDIEKRLGHKVAPLGKDYSTPADWAAARAGEGGDDAVVYGKRAGGTMNAEAAARQARAERSEAGGEPALGAACLPHAVLLAALKDMAAESRSLVRLLQEWLAPKVAKLAELEHSTQSMFWAIKQQFAPGAR